MKSFIKISGKAISVIILFLISFNVKSQDYELNFSDPSTFSITCGMVNPGTWMVRNDTCELYTPYIVCKSEKGAEVEFSFMVNQSGNGDTEDKGYVYYSIDGGDWELDTTWSASKFPAVYTLTTSFPLDYEHYIQFKVRLATDNKTDFWGILDKGITATDGDDSEHLIGAQGSEPDSDLPVTLLSFSGFFKNNVVTLKWSTASEINNDYFIIEKSSNGQDFLEIGIVSGSGNSNNILNYVFEDEKAISNSFYRLKQVDFNGAYTFSQIIEVTVSDRESNNIKVTSAGGQINIMTENCQAGIMEVKLYNINGAKVFESQQNVEKGSNTVSISPDVAGNSIYILSASVNGGLAVNSKILFN